MNSKKISIAWHTPVAHTDPNAMPASVWIRCLQLIPYLRQLGIESTINPEDFNADIAVFVRFQSEDAARIAKRYKENGKKVITDVVVNYFSTSKYPYANAYIDSVLVEQLHGMLAYSDAVFCASECLMREAKKYHPHAVCLEDSLDPEMFRYRKNPEDFFKMGKRAIWAGASVKLQENEPVLNLLYKNNVSFTAITDTPQGAVPKIYRKSFFRKKLFRYSHIPWRYETFAQNILAGDFFVGYRDLSYVYNTGHSSFKVACFLAQGIPVLASPVPSYVPLLQDGLAGRICIAQEDWEEALALVSHDLDVLKRWSKKAPSVVAHLATNNVAVRYRDCFLQLL